jgi:hypothetical protein
MGTINEKRTCDITLFTAVNVVTGWVSMLVWLELQQRLPFYTGEYEWWEDDHRVGEISVPR